MASSSVSSSQEASCTWVEVRGIGVFQQAPGDRMCHEVLGSAIVMGAPNRHLRDAHRSRTRDRLQWETLERAGHLHHTILIVPEAALTE